MAGLTLKFDPLNDATSWRSLTVFASYRLFLAAILLAVFYFDLPPSFLGESVPVYTGSSGRSIFYSL